VPSNVAPKGDLNLRSNELVSVLGHRAHSAFLPFEPYLRGGERDARVSANVRRCENHFFLQPVAAPLVAGLSALTAFGLGVPGVLMHAQVIDGVRRERTRTTPPRS
jgi:hypothetical protein